jgi:homoserine O-acetyltransferase
MSEHSAHTTAAGARQPANRIRTLRVDRFALESGQVVPELTQAWERYGELNERRDNAVFVFHSLTGSAAAEQWWRGVVGPGCAIDTEQYAVYCPNLLGSCYGTHGLPADAAVTPRDMARFAALLVAHEGIRSVALAAGGSLGGMVALEWAAELRSLNRAVVVFAAPAAHTAFAIGYNHVQRRALELGGEAGIALARMAAVLTYRTSAEFEARFGRERREDGVFQVQSYLEHHGEKLAARMDAPSYRRLIDAMDAHDVGRGRGGVAAALRSTRTRLHGVGIVGDLLYSPEDVRSWVQAAGGSYHELSSTHGHDAFLLEQEAVSAVLRRVLAAVDTERTAGLEVAS